MTGDGPTEGRSGDHAVEFHDGPDAEALAEGSGKGVALE